ncbi:MAG TPA: tetratricopeptide repeat protein [Chitinophagaceae bacterium]|nr:tetratricopeptide repeat protein [Chitinophagaceae bacterium]
MRKCLLFITTLLFCKAGLFSQGVDSLWRKFRLEKDEKQKPLLLANIAFATANTNPGSAINLSKAAMALSIKVKNDTALAASNNSLGWAYYSSSKTELALQYLEVARALYRGINWPRGEGRAMLNISTVYQSQKNYEKALTYILQAVKLFEKVNDERALAYAQRQLGITYRDLGQPAKAKVYLLSSLASFKRLNEKLYTCDALSALGSLYLNEKLYDSALYFHKEALKLTGSETSISAAYSWDNVADVYYQLSRNRTIHPYIDSALEYYNQSHDIFQRLNSAADVAYENIKVGKCRHTLKEYTVAIDLLTASLNYFKQDSEIEYEFDAAKELSETYRDQGDFELALKYLQQSTGFKDSIDAHNNKDLMANMFAKYEADKKDSTIVLLNTEEKLAKQEISRQHIITIFTASLIILGGFLVFILWNRNRIKQKLKEVEMRNQISSDLHDDIGSSLSSILLLSNIAVDERLDSPTNKHLLSKINSNAKEVIDRMSDIVWTMNPKYDEGESLRERIENYIVRLKEIGNVNIIVNIDSKIDQHHFTMELRKNIFLIIKEAINNALKYSGATQILLDFVTGDRYFILSVKDNGKGFDKNAVQPGNGFETMINRAKASQGACEIVSAPGNGTVIKAVIPIPNIR